MNSMEARTRIEGLLNKREETLTSAANIVAKFVVSRSNKVNGEITISDIDTILTDLTTDERYIIMVKVISILAQSSDLKVNDDNSNNKKSQRNSIFASRGYN